MMLETEFIVNKSDQNFFIKDIMNPLGIGRVLTEFLIQSSFEPRHEKTCLLHM